MEFIIIFLVNRYFHVVILLTKAVFVDKSTVKGLIVYYVLGKGGGGGGFLKNQVYENFTPPPKKKNFFSNKRFTPHCNASLKILPPPLPSHALTKEIERYMAYHTPHYSGTAVSHLVPEMHKIALTVILDGPLFI